MGGIIRIQREIVKLLNKESQGYETQLLEELALFVNRISPFEIHEAGPFHWILRNKRTLKEVQL